MNAVNMVSNIFGLDLTQSKFIQNIICRTSEILFLLKMQQSPKSSMFFILTARSLEQTDTNWSGYSFSVSSLHVTFCVFHIPFIGAWW
jgi:hypothetical protein